MTLLLVLQLALTVPNPDLTPGVVRPLTLHQICTTRWGTWSQRHTVEFDHLIPRSLGGADAVANLWPQPWADAHAKDVVEARLARGICDGSIPLAAARAQMQQWGRR